MTFGRPVRFSLGNDLDCEDSEAVGQKSTQKTSDIKVSATDLQEDGIFFAKHASKEVYRRY